MTTNTLFLKFKNNYSADYRGGLKNQFTVYYSNGFLVLFHEQVL